MLYIPVLLFSIAVFLAVLAFCRSHFSNPVSEILGGFTSRSPDNRETALIVARRLGSLVARVPLLRDMFLLERTERNLYLAGYGISAYEWFGIWALISGAGVFLGIIAWSGRALPLLLAALFPLLGFAIPKAVLDSRVSLIKAEMRREFVMTTEKIALYSDVGVPLTSAFKACVSDTFLGRELAHLIQDVNLGIPLEKALDSFTERTDLTEAVDFTRAIKNAQRFGTEHLSDVLGKYVEDMRNARMSRVEEVARKMESKTIIPVVCSVYPAVFLIIIGPLALIFVRTAMNVM